jgi:NitT/TauT family transport system substrate-binding protein
MSCCDESTARVPDTDVSRRAVLKGAALIASVIPGAQRAEAQGKPIKLAYCSQLLCGVPYEVARSGGHFKNHGLDVELVYTRGGSAAMQALIGGAVDYAATSLDVAITAYANVGADIRRFAVTGRLPLFAVVTAPKTAGQIHALKDLEGKTVAVSGLGNADHALTLYLLKQANADPNKVKFATMGVNLLEGLRQGQIDAGLVQEPARACWSTPWTSPTRAAISAAPTSSWASRCAARKSSSAGRTWSSSRRLSPTRSRPCAR